MYIVYKWYLDLEYAYWTEVGVHSWNYYRIL